VEPGLFGVTPAERLQDLLEEIELADRAGLDVFGVGEHHRPDSSVSAPAVVLAAAASRTRRIRLTSAVSVIGSDDPVRVFQQFATLDLLSGGRAEIMAGRGSFIESFPLFGHDRFLIQLSVGTLPHRGLMRAIELFATEVAPVVRKEVRQEPA
jgi:alkanesulfonate monooxygenase SsuD/methylene tetrahydromethanopterin reductase-like flavin-dependent oxidoreductase (luciferase family)